MIKTFTKDDLVRFLYDELPESEKLELEKALITDEDLNNKFESLQSIVADLCKVDYSPSSGVIDRILSFSKQFQKQSV